MEKIAINPNRLKWCCEELKLDISNLPKETKIAKTTLDKAMKGKDALSIEQL